MALVVAKADACTRILYELGTKDAIVGRTMDWMVDPNTDLWAFPKGMERDGGVGARSIKWTSKYGSVISSFYNVATVDGINDAGLVANTLYLAEADYGDAKSSTKPEISVGAWTQYALDNFATVAEAVDALSKEPFVIVAPDLPGGAKATGHLALADASGDSAIFEYIGGKLVIHHGAEIYGHDQFAAVRAAARARRLLAGHRRFEIPAGHDPLAGSFRPGELLSERGAPREGPTAGRRDRVLVDPQRFGAAGDRRSA